MPFVVTMPKLSPTMEEGFIAKWHKKEGDRVEAGDLLLEISTDKATVEHNALDEGWLRKILISEGKGARINQPIAVFTETKDESIEGFQLPSPEKKDEPAPSIEAEQSVSDEPKKEKKAASYDQPVFEPEPPLKNIVFESGSTEDRIIASPLARRLAEEKGLDLSTVVGTGPGGRITSEDLERAQPAGIVSFGKRERPTHPAGSYEEIPLSPMRKIVGKRLQESKSFIPHFYVKQVIDASPLFALRDQLKNLGLKITFNDFVIRAAALALRKHPEVNSGFNSKNQTIIQFQTIDISIAVNVEGGLITPIIRYADYKNLGQLSVEMRLLAEKARKGHLTEQEYKGGSFCISNLGMFGITEFYAVINPPQSAILAVGGIEDVPVVKNGQVIAGKTLALTLSVDHRVIDGALAAQFLKTLQTLLENPVSLTIS